MRLARADGTFSSDNKDIGEAASNFYQHLFSGYTPPPMLDDLTKIPHSVSEEKNKSLIITPDAAEILEALKIVNINGALGPDGFSIPFYIRFWEVIKSDLTKAISAFFLWSPTLQILVSHDAHPDTKSSQCYVH